MLIKSATKVELKATPRLAVIPAMSPSTAMCAWERASPIPLTVPINPIEGIAQIMYLIIESSDSILSASLSQIACVDEVASPISLEIEKLFNPPQREANKIDSSFLGIRFSISSLSWMALSLLLDHFYLSVKNCFLEAPIV